MSTSKIVAGITVEKPDEARLKELGAKKWPIWTKEPSVFDWQYDAEETCYVLEGEVTVTAGDEHISFGKGDLVIFPKGLACTWQVKKAVRKHYKFG